MHDPHVLLQLHKLWLIHFPLRSLAHGSVVQYHIFHLFLVQLLVCFAHQSIELLGIKVILY
jgi:hypothetical protein